MIQQEVFITQARAMLRLAQDIQRDVNYLLLYDLSERIEAVLETKRVHLRDSQGRLITHFDEWLLAAEQGRWPATAGVNESEKPQ